MISCYSGASEAVSARIGSAWKKFRELNDVLVGKQVLLYCCETWELTVADEARRGCMRWSAVGSGCVGWDWSIGCRLDVLQDRVGVVVKIKDIIQSCLRWYGHVIRQDINYQIREIVGLAITGKWEGSTKEIVGRVREGFGTIWLEKRGCARSREWGEQTKAKIANRGHPDAVVLVPTKLIII